MKSLLKRTTWILPVAVLLFACGGEKKKETVVAEATPASTTKTLEIEKTAYQRASFFDVSPIEVPEVTFNIAVEKKQIGSYHIIAGAFRDPLNDLIESKLSVEDKEKYADNMYNIQETKTGFIDGVKNTATDLLDLYKTKFNDIIPYIKREHVSGFYSRRPLWLTKNLSLSTVRKEIVKMESDAANFYYDATQKASDPDVRKLLGDLAAIESKHGEKATLKLSKIESSEIGDEEIKKDENYNKQIKEYFKKSSN